VNYQVTWTPSYKSWDNKRTTSIYARVSFDSSLVHLSGRVDLSGQYSTMTRGAYLYGFRDSSVLLQYNRLIYDIEGARLQKKELLSLSKEYPFSCSIGAEYSSNKLLAKKSDSTYVLDISGWMNFIFREGFDPEYYQASFYPDFAGEDAFFIGIRFPAQVTLLNSADYLYLINNSFAYLRCHISQPQKDFLVIETNFKIKTEEVPADNIADVDEIFRALTKLTHAKLLIGISGKGN
jgi:hypothetical protein